MVARWPLKIVPGSQIEKAGSQLAPKTFGQRLSPAMAPASQGWTYNEGGLYFIIRVTGSSNFEPIRLQSSALNRPTQQYILEYFTLDLVPR